MTLVAKLSYEAAMVTLSEPQTRSSPKRSWYRIEGAAVGLVFGLCWMVALALASGVGGGVFLRPVLDAAVGSGVGVRRGAGPEDGPRSRRGVPGPPQSRRRAAGS